MKAKISKAGINLATPPLLRPTYARPGRPAQDLIVACVYWGNKYSLDYVYRLRGSLNQKLHRQHRFVCLSDRDIHGIDTIPCFAKNWEGWWQKVSLFSPDMFPAGSRILYLDLDVVLTNSIGPLADLTADEPLIMIENFGPNKAHAAHNSSVMLWSHGDPRVANIYSLFTPDVMSSLHGDQCWIWRVLREQIANFPPGMVKSYKYDYRGRMERVPGASVVVFHGDPKPHEVKEAWVTLNWGR